MDSETERDIERLAKQNAIDSLQSAMDSLFNMCWECSKEGTAYWVKVYKMIEKVQVLIKEVK